MNKTYSLTDSQIKNLLIFLNRVNISGNYKKVATEIQAINEILQVLNNPINTNQPVPINPEEVNK